MKVIAIDTRVRYEDKAAYVTRRVEAKVIPFELEIPDDLFAVGDWSRKPVLELTVHTSLGDVTAEIPLAKVLHDNFGPGAAPFNDPLRTAIEAMK